MSVSRVAIVVPCTTMNAYVEECLAHCLALEYPAFTLALLPDAPVCLPERLRDERVVVLPTGAVTIAAKRNRALASFPDAEYFALIDSDARPAPDWLSRGVESFAVDPRIMAVGGPNITPPEEAISRRAVGNALQSWLVSGYLAFAKRRSPSRFVPNLHSCNLIIPAATFRAVGHFDESLDTGEDREFCGRVRQAGGSILFKHDVVVYHHNRRLLVPFFLQRITYGYDVFRLLRRRRTTVDLLLVIPLASVIAFAALIVGASAGMVPPAVPVILASLYAAAVAFEAVRFSAALGEIVPTLLAIVAANVAYVGGELIGLLGVRLNVKQIYRNDPVD